MLLLINEWLHVILRNTWVWVHSPPPSSFGMTEGYFVFLEQPLYINLSRIFINKLCGTPLAKGLFIFDNEKVKLMLHCNPAKSTSKVEHFQANPLDLWLPLNCAKLITKVQCHIFSVAIWAEIWLTALKFRLLFAEKWPANVHIFDCEVLVVAKTTLISITPSGN